MIWMIAVGMVAALVGCASADEAGNETDPSATPTATNDQTGAKDSTHSATNDPKTPAFDPQFDQVGSTTDPSKDPTPPGGADQCIDTDDSGSTENLAKALPPTDDCNNDLIEAKGIANGGVDVDFFSLSTSDKFGCALDTDFEIATPNTEMCVYARCKNSTDDAVTGCEEGTEATSAIGMKGCCTTGPGKAIPKWDCSGIADNDSADFFISVKQANNGEQCLPYSFKYRF